MSRIAIVGAGLAGLVLARELAVSHEVTLFEKARGVGGRMSTRYAGPYEFDHGAQFFTARSARFRRFLEPHIAAGTVAAWPATFVELTGREITARRDWADGHPHYVGAPRMNALCTALAANLDLRLATRVTELRRRGQRWRLILDSGDGGEFDWVVSTAPAPQTAALLPANSPLQRSTAAADMLACYALMLGFESPPELDWQAARVRDSDLSWISVNSSKPGRRSPFTLVAHSTNAWAEAHLEDDRVDVREHLVGEVAAVTGLRPAAAPHCALHRWRYANLPRRADDVLQVDAEQRLAVCGDWCIRGRVEAAYLSAAQAADELAELL